MEHPKEPTFRLEWRERCGQAPQEGPQRFFDEQTCGAAGPENLSKGVGMMHQHRGFSLSLSLSLTIFPGCQEMVEEEEEGEGGGGSAR